MDWDTAEQLAVDWLEQRCREERAPSALVFVETLDQARQGGGPLATFGRRHEVASRLSPPRWQPHRPVVAAWPSVSWFDTAQKVARGSSLVVIEGFTCPMSGWAQEVGALDLTAGEVTPDVRSEEQLALLDRLAFHGNNAWGDSLNKQVVPGILERLIESGADEPTIVGSMLARGASGRGVKNLTRYLERL